MKWWLLCLLHGCSKPVVDTGDTAPAQVRQSPAFECEVDPTLKVVGPDPPLVGDSWTIWLYCGDTLLTGVTVLKFDPPDFATVQSNVATFLNAGTATMTVQVGRYQASREVTVLEAER